METYKDQLNQNLESKIKEIKLQEKINILNTELDFLDRASKYVLAIIFTTASLWFLI